MEATEILMHEHRIIEFVLDSLEVAAGRLRAGEFVPPGFFFEAAGFIKGFADGCHHSKEEGVLFPALEAAGIPREGGPVGMMLAEHERARQFTRDMRSGAEKLQHGDAGAAATVWRNAQSYVDLLRQHIAKEDTVLFVMADRVIPEAGRQELAEAFERVEREEVGEGAHEKYLAVAEELQKQMRT